MPEDSVLQDLMSTQSNDVDGSEEELQGGEEEKSTSQPTGDIRKEVMGQVAYQLREQDRRFSDKLDQFQQLLLSSLTGGKTEEVEESVGEESGNGFLAEYRRARESGDLEGEVESLNKIFSELPTRVQDTVYKTLEKRDREFSEKVSREHEVARRQLDSLFAQTGLDEEFKELSGNDPNHPIQQALQDAYNESVKTSNGYLRTEHIPLLFGKIQKVIRDYRKKMEVNEATDAAQAPFSNFLGIPSSPPRQLSPTQLFSRKKDGTIEFTGRELPSRGQIEKTSFAEAKALQSALSRALQGG